ncbi:MAG: hypothetical protein IKD59_05420 [Lachnospiraceae bacterium]|nr:hypothetical protein [Lachnospiraceae bacterium]
MKKLYLPFGIVFVLMSLPMLLLNVFAGAAMLAFGVVLILRSRKKEEAPIERFVHVDRKIYDQDQEWNDRFYKEHLEELTENDDYHLPKSKLLEDHEGDRVYMYEERSFPCDVRGLEVFYGEKRVGTIKKPLDDYISASIVLCGGKYKYATEDEVDVDSVDPWFYLDIKKRTA